MGIFEKIYFIPEFRLQWPIVPLTATMTEQFCLTHASCHSRDDWHWTAHTTSHTIAYYSRRPVCAFMRTCNESLQTFSITLLNSGNTTVWGMKKTHVEIVLCTKVKKGNEVSISSVFEIRGSVKLCLLRWASSQYKNLKPEFWQNIWHLFDLFALDLEVLPGNCRENYFH